MGLFETIGKMAGSLPSTGILGMMGSQPAADATGTPQAPRPARGIFDLFTKPGALIDTAKDKAKKPGSILGIGY